MLHVPLVQADLHQGVLYCLGHLAALEDPLKKCQSSAHVKDTVCGQQKVIAEKKHLTYRRT